MISTGGRGSQLLSLFRMSTFRGVSRTFEEFLGSVKDEPALAPTPGADPRNAHFIPRNFLLDERIDDDRAASYAAELSPDGPSSFDDWNTTHNRYLGAHVFLPSSGTEDYRSIAIDDETSCPATFRAPLSTGHFDGTDLD